MSWDASLLSNHIRLINVDGRKWQRTKIFHSQYSLGYQLRLITQATTHHSQVKRLDKGVIMASTVYPKKYAHGFVVLCFVVVMQSFIMNSHKVFIHIHQGCFAGTGAIVRLPQCQWSKPDGYGKISQYITTTKHSKAKTVCIFLGIYCNNGHAFGQQISFTFPLSTRVRHWSL